MEDPVAVEYVIAFENSDDTIADVAIIEEANTVDTLSVLVKDIISIMVLLMMVFAVNELTDKVLPTRVLKVPESNPTFDPKRVDTVSVESTTPTLV